MARDKSKKLEEFIQTLRVSSFTVEELLAYPEVKKIGLVRGSVIHLLTSLMKKGIISKSPMRATDGEGRKRTLTYLIRREREEKEEREEREVTDEPLQTEEEKTDSMVSYSGYLLGQEFNESSLKSLKELAGNFNEGVKEATKNFCEKEKKDTLLFPPSSVSFGGSSGLLQQLGEALEEIVKRESNALLTSAERVHAYEIGCVKEDLKSKEEELLALKTELEKLKNSLSLSEEKTKLTEAGYTDVEEVLSALRKNREENLSLSAEKDKLLAEIKKMVDLGKQTAEGWEEAESSRKSIKLTLKSLEKEKTKLQKELDEAKNLLQKSQEEIKTMKNDRLALIAKKQKDVATVEFVTKNNFKIEMEKITTYYEEKIRVLQKTLEERGR